MKNVIFTGFFCMKQSHALKYITMWNKLGYNVDFEPYKISDVLLGGNRYKTIRNNFIPKNKHYDAAYCISGGCLHMLNIISAKNNFTINKIIFDSGPYLFSSKHIEHYIHYSFCEPNNIYKLPLNNFINNMYKINNINLDNHNEEYYKLLLKPELPKLILTSKKDKIIVNDFISTLKNTNNIQHHEFENGKHGNIYIPNKDLYMEHINNFMKTNTFNPQ
jgi:hypothetical protein